MSAVFDQITASLTSLSQPPSYTNGVYSSQFKTDILNVMRSAAPLFLSFLASQFGLGKLPTALRKAIGYVPKKIENALRKGLQKFAKNANGGTAVKEKNASLTTNKNAADEFTYNNKQYRLVVAAESKGGTTIKIVDKETNKPVGQPLKEEHFTTAEAKQEFCELAMKADDLRNKAKKPLGGQPRANVAALKPLQADVNKERDDVKSERVMAKCVFLNAGCFAAGTKLWTPQGYRAIEDIRPGERIYSRDQWDEHGEIVAKIVEEVFERYTTVLEVVADGRTIRTTGEHPFFVDGKGWTPANELRVGDRLACADTGKTVTVEAVRDTGERELVYNLRVADFHTYFVGDESWGWAAWAHNVYLMTEAYKNPTTSTEHIVVRIKEEEKSPAKQSFVGAGWLSSVKNKGDALRFDNTAAALKVVTDKIAPINKLAEAFMAALKANSGYSYTVRRDLFTQYGQGYNGDFSKPEGDGQKENETDITTGRDGLFNALVYAPGHGIDTTHRKRIRTAKAKAVFTAINLNGLLPGDDLWLAPEPPTDAEVDALTPTNEPGGYAIPTAAYPLAVRHAKISPHKMAARYERAMAYQIHQGTEEKFAEHAGIVIWWGDRIGSNGSADAISVHPTTGQVTLWDSKAYANGSPNIQSKTFTKPGPRAVAVAHAVEMIEAFAWKPEDLDPLGRNLKAKALASLVPGTGNYKMMTVRYQPQNGSNAFTPVKLNKYIP